MSRNVSLFLNKLNQNLRIKRYSLVVPKNTIILRLVFFFYQEGYFDFFYCKNNKIFFKIRTFSHYTALSHAIYGVSFGQKKHHTLVAINKYTAKNFGSLFYTTPKGLLTDKQAAKSKCGGTLLCYIF